MFTYTYIYIYIHTHIIFTRYVLNMNISNMKIYKCVIYKLYTHPHYVAMKKRANRHYQIYLRLDYFFAGDLLQVSSKPQTAPLLHPVSDR